MENKIVRKFYVLDMFGNIQYWFVAENGSTYLVDYQTYVETKAPERLH